MKRLLASFLFLAALAAHAQIATGSATPRTTGTGNSVFPEQQVFPGGLPGLFQTRNRDVATVRRELGPVMGFVFGESGTGGSYTSPLDGVVTTWAEMDSWTYNGQMYMEAGTTYMFATSIDDYATIIIDGKSVVYQNRSCLFTTGSYTPTETGWHDIEVSVRDNGGGYGYCNGFTKGIAYNTAGQTSQSYSGWIQLVDPGDGSLLRTGRKLAYKGLRVSAQMRESDPTVMDVDYIVYTDPTTTPTVNVRTLAFENNARGFAMVVRPETFIEGTDANLGDGIAANVAHRLSWKVSSDWATDLAKVSFEVMAMKPGDLLLPDMHFITIPATNSSLKMIVSVNDLSRHAAYITRDPNLYGGIYYQKWWAGFSPQVVGHRPLLNSLLWLYASGEEDLSLADGVLKNGSRELVRHAAFLLNHSGGDCNANPEFPGHWSLNPNAIQYVFGKMGYKLLEARDLAWVNENTRLNLQPQQFRQYAVKTVRE